MSLIDEILKGLPENALLGSKVADLISTNDGNEELIAILKDDKRQDAAKIAKLEKRIEELSHVDDIDEIELKLLHRIAHLDYDSAFTDNITQGFDLSVARVDYYIQRLQDLGYARSGVIDHYGIHYAATQEGRTLLLKNNLL